MRPEMGGRGARFEVENTFQNCFSTVSGWETPSSLTEQLIMPLLMMVAVTPLQVLVYA